MWTDHCWAVFKQFGDSQLFWTYGTFPDSNIPELAVRLAKGMDDLGIKSFQEGIGSVILNDARKYPPEPLELFIVSHGSFYFVAANPRITAHIFQAIEASIPVEICELLRSVLAGQLTKLYGDCWIADLTQESQEFLDQIFQEGLKELGKTARNRRAWVAEGMCSLSALSFAELLFYYSYIREQFQNEIAPLLGQPWGILLDISGVRIYLKYRPPDVPNLPEFLSIITSSLNTLFEGAQVKQLLFGKQGFYAVDVFQGRNVILVSNNLLNLLKDKKFVDKLTNIKKEVLNDVAPGMREYLIEQLLREEEDWLSRKDLSELLRKAEKRPLTFQEVLRKKFFGR